MSANPYDQVPYQSHAYAASHPARLSMIATLFGLKPAAPGHCRALEIGCASGGNLLPMAALFPESRFVGLDYSGVQIDAARAAQQELGLTNIEFRCEDIRQIDVNTLGKFDYVIAHGIYSWLPPDAQEAMLGLYRDCLADDGVGHISYNTLPGWRMRGIVRDMMLFHAELFGDNAKKVEQAKALLDFVAGAIPAENNPYGAYLRSELQLVNSVNDSYLRHDHLEEHNEPLYFRDFMRRANDKGLHYLGESEFSTMVGTGIDATALASLKAEITDIVRLEQYMDFLSNRSFRQTLLVKNGNAIQRNIVGERLLGLHVSGNLTPDRSARMDDASAVLFKTAAGQGVQTGNPVTKAAFGVLAELFPASVAVPDLVRAARERLPAPHCGTTSEQQDAAALANDLLIAYTMLGLIQLSGAPTPAAANTGEVPLATAYSRWQAGKTNLVTSLRHETVMLGEPERLLLAELDGKKTRAGLAAIMHGHFVAGQLRMETDGEAVTPDKDSPVLLQLTESLLTTLAKNALLMTHPEDI